MSEARANAAGAIYGTILVTALVAGLSEEEAIGAGEIAGSVAATTLVFWLAHVYADTMAGGLTRRAGAAARRAAAHEWPLVQSAVAPCLALLAAMVGMWSRDTGVDVAIGLGIAALFGWGWETARRSGRGRLRSLASGLVNAAFGLAIVALKIAVG